MYARKEHGGNSSRLLFTLNSLRKICLQLMEGKEILRSPSISSSIFLPARNDSPLKLEFPQTLSSGYEYKYTSIHARQTRKKKNTFYPHSGCGSKENDLINDDCLSCTISRIVPSIKSRNFLNYTAVTIGAWQFWNHNSVVTVSKKTLDFPSGSLSLQQLGEPVELKTKSKFYTNLICYVQARSHANLHCVKVIACISLNWKIYYTYKQKKNRPNGKKITFFVQNWSNSDE